MLSDSRVEPTYMALADALSRSIARRSPGSPVESENELARAHGVHRLTARAALDELERRHLVRRERGRGTYVAERIPYLISEALAPSYSDTVRAAGGEPGGVTERIRVAVPSRDIRERLRLGHGDRALLLQRTRLLNGAVAGCADTWLAADLVPGLAEEFGDADSLNDHLTRRGLRPVRAYARVGVEIAPTDIARRLDHPGRPLAFHLRSRTDSRRHNRPLETTQAWFRADLFDVAVELGRAT